MTKLTIIHRAEIQAEFMRAISAERHDLALRKPDLRDAIRAVDAWLADNAQSYNAALPKTARTSLSEADNTRLFCLVAAKRMEITHG